MINHRGAGPVGGLPEIRCWGSAVHMQGRLGSATLARRLRDRDPGLEGREAAGNALAYPCWLRVRVSSSFVSPNSSAQGELCRACACPACPARDHGPLTSWRGNERPPSTDSPVRPGQPTCRRRCYCTAPVTSPAYTAPSASRAGVAQGPFPCRRRCRTGRARRTAGRTRSCP